MGCRYLTILLLVATSPLLATAEMFNVHASDLQDPSYFGLNPAASPKDGLFFSFFSDRRNGENALVFKQNEEKTERPTKVEKNMTALALSSTMGGGLNIGVSAQDFTSTDKSYNGVGDSQPTVENFETTVVDLKAAVDFTKSFRIGIAMHAVRVGNTIYGGYYLDGYNSDNKTYFQSVMYSPALGVLAISGPTRFGFAYQLPLRGGAVIRNEQKIISHPGSAEVALTTENNPWTFGILARRYFYRHDDRAIDTHLAGPDTASIDLFGLNAERNALFLVTQLAAGIDYKVEQRWGVKATVYQNYIDYTDYSKKLPDSDNLKYSYLRYLLSLIVHKQEVSFTLGAGYAQPKVDVGGQRDIVYRGRELSLYGGVGMTF